MTFQEMVLYIMFAWILLSALKNFSPYFSALLGRPTKRKSEDPIDILTEIYRSHKLAAKLGKRGVARRLYLISDGDVPPITYRYIGIIQDSRCAEIFWKPRFWTAPRWVICPVDLIVDYHARDIRIRARQFTRYGGIFWVPVLTYINCKERSRYLQQIEDYIQDMLEFESSILANENRLNSIATASQTERVPVAELMHRDALISRDVRPGQEGEPVGQDKGGSYG